MKNIVLLGSTGSIGQSALAVMRRFPDRCRVLALSANTNGALLAAQARLFHPQFVAIVDPAAACEIREDLPAGTRLLVGAEGVLQLAQLAEADLVINAIVGSAGLMPSLTAIEAGQTLALANKETLVMAGALIMQKAQERGVEILPIDSEHSAIKQCLSSGRREEIRRLILTCSGGPFLKTAAAEFDRITVAQALNHPTWNMGKKVTIDSATLMNKGLEIIEAHHLFGIPEEQIEVVVHPQSLVHSFVEFIDGSVMAQLGIPDMKIPLQYALFYPERLASDNGAFCLTRFQSLDFEEPDQEKFRCLALAREALKKGGTAPTVLNASDEYAVDAFLQEEIGFNEIPLVIAEVLQAHQVKTSPALEEILAADEWAKREAQMFISARRKRAVFGAPNHKRGLSR